MTEIFCKKCGKIVQPTDLYCRKCGSPILPITITAEQILPDQPNHGKEKLDNTTNVSKEQTSILKTIGIVIGWVLLSGIASAIGGVIGAGLLQNDMACATPALWGTFFLGFIVFRKNKRVTIGLIGLMVFICLASVIAIY